VKISLKKRWHRVGIIFNIFIFNIWFDRTCIISTEIIETSFKSLEK